MGESTLDKNHSLNLLENGKADGYFQNPKTWGTYIHGIFDNEQVISYLLQHNAGINSRQKFDYQNFKEEQYNKLATHVKKCMDMDLIYRNLMTQAE